LVLAEVFPFSSFLPSYKHNTFCIWKSQELKFIFFILFSASLLKHIILSCAVYRRWNIRKAQLQITVEAVFPTLIFALLSNIGLYLF
jgi:hypothetical protein